MEPEIEGDARDLLALDEESLTSSRILSTAVAQLHRQQAWDQEFAATPAEPPPRRSVAPPTPPKQTSGMFSKLKSLSMKGLRQSSSPNVEHGVTNQDSSTVAVMSPPSPEKGLWGMLKSGAEKFKKKFDVAAANRGLGALQAKTHLLPVRDRIWTLEPRACPRSLKTPQKLLEL
jgi:hypothetical protein